MIASWCFVWTRTNILQLYSYLYLICFPPDHVRKCSLNLSILTYLINSRNNDLTNYLLCSLGGRHCPRIIVSWKRCSIWGVIFVPLSVLWQMFGFWIFLTWLGGIYSYICIFYSLLLPLGRVYVWYMNTLSAMHGCSGRSAYFYFLVIWVYYYIS